MLYALIAAVLLACAGSYKVTSLYYQHVIDQTEQEARADVDAANERANKAASDYEVWKANNRPKAVATQRKVADAVQADADCSSKPLPDGLRAALAQAGADANQPLAAGAMPAPPSAFSLDLGSAGNRLLGRARGVVGLSSEASRPR